MKSVILFVAVMIFLLARPFVAGAISAKSYILIDSANGRVLQEHNAYEQKGPASCTKILTALVALEHAKLDDIVTTSANASVTEGTSIYLKAGEKATMEDLLYAVILSSGNDAAVAVAEHVGGSVEKFAQLMNETAEKIGANHSHFVNPHGLYDPNHYTTAYDLAQITRYALKNEVFAQICKAKSKNIPREGYRWGRTLSNHNKMLNMYAGADGVKTGYTKKTGRTLVSSATRNGFRLIAVTLDAPNDWQDHADMLDYGFADYQLVPLISAESSVQSVQAGRYLYEIFAEEDLNCVLNQEEIAKVTYDYSITKPLTGKIVDGENVGEVRAYLGNEILGKSNLTAKKTLASNKKGARSSHPSFMRLFAENFCALWYRLAVR